MIIKRDYYLKKIIDKRELEIGILTEISIKVVIKIIIGEQIVKKYD